MPNPSGPDRDNTSDAGDRGAAGDPVESEADTAVEPTAGADEKTTEGYRAADPATEVIGPAGQEQQPPMPQLQPGERRFTAEIVTRNGVFMEDLILRQAGNNQWMRASRVRQGMRLLETDIDSAWPRNAKGDVNWGR